MKRLVLPENQTGKHVHKERHDERLPDLRRLLRVPSPTGRSMPRFESSAEQRGVNNWTYQRITYLPGGTSGTAILSTISM